MIRISGDRGDIVLGWLTKLVVILGVLGVLGFDGIALTQARVQAADRATTAAVAAADDYRANHDAQRAFDAAYATLVDPDSIETKSFAISPDGTVRLRLHHTATTLVLHRIRALSHFAEAVETGEARPPT